MNFYDVSDEVNPELIANTLNSNDFSTTLDHIDAGNGVTFDDLSFSINPDVVPGQVRVATSPLIKIMLSGAEANFEMHGDTNIFGSGRIDITGRLSISANHTYRADKLEFQNITFLSLNVQQAPGFSETVRGILNREVPPLIKDDDDLLREVASLLNAAIEDANNSCDSSRCKVLLSFERFGVEAVK